MVRIRKEVDVGLNFLTRGIKNFNRDIENFNKGVMQSKKGFDVLTNTARNYNRSIQSIQRISRDYNMQLTKSGKSLRTNEGGLLKNTNALNQYIGANSGLGKVMGMNIEDLSAFNKQGGRFTSMGGRFANRVRMMTHGMRGFRMEMLGVMFFGMALTRAIGGLAGKSIEWMGVMDVLGAALGILFLPLAEKLLDWAIKFMDWVDQLTESQKAWYSKIALVIAGVGLLITVIGTLGLGIGSLIMAFGFLFSPMGLIIGALASIASYIFLKDMFRDLDDKLVAFGISGEAFDKFSQRAKDAIPKIANFFKETRIKIANFLTDNIPQFIESGYEFISALAKGLFNNLDRIIDSGKKILNKLVNQLYENKKIISDALSKMIEEFITWIGQNSDKIAAIGIAIAKGIISGILKGFQNLAKSLRNKIDDMLGIKKGSKMSSFLWGPSMEKGGIVPGSPGQEVPIVAHAGERVIPAGQDAGMGTTNITVNANVSSDYDVRRLADQLKRYWVEDFERSTQTRGI